MSDQKISALVALSLISSPIALSASAPSKTVSTTASSETTSQRAAARKMRHQLASISMLQPMGTYVGELQEKWQFPSDHLPIAMTFDNLHFASWNVLDAEYMRWVTEKNSQGLSRSMIADEHVYIGDSKLTMRDKHVADLILQMISHSTHPRDLLCLQECSSAFVEELRSKLPAHFEIIKGREETIVLNRNCFEIISKKEVPGIYTDEPQDTFIDVILRRLDNGQNLRVLNAHIPGDPKKPGRFEFAQYLANTFDPALTTIAMGDMNFNELEMSDAMKQAFPSSSPFSLYSPYCTNISPYTLNSKAIDHFLVYSPDKVPVVLNRPNEIMRGLGAIVALLQKSEQVQAQALFQYFLNELELDAQMSREEQDEKIQEFKTVSRDLSPEVASVLIPLLLEETRTRIIDMLQNAGLEESEIKAYLADNDKAIQRVQNMDVETARQMLFFVAELKIHRQYVYEFGITLGAPAKQLLRHDLCKLSAEQFEAYVRYFRGGRLESDKAAYLAAWEIHQHEEHHLESYRKEEGYIDHFSDERLQKNMLETTADMLAATKQRGGGSLTDWLINVFPKSNPHPRLIPFLRKGLQAAHEFYLESSDSDSLFKDLPCWNSEIEEMFRKLATDAG